MRQYSAKSRLVVVLVGIVCLGLVAFFFGRWRNTSSSRSDESVRLAEASTIAGIDLSRCVNIPRGQLTKNYEPTERVPPYESDGETPDPERFATAPQDPFELARDLTKSGSDKSISDTLMQLGEGYLAGKDVTSARLDGFESSCQTSSLHPIVLLRAARGCQWLGRLTQVGRAMDRAAIHQVKNVADHSTAGDPGLLPLIHELDATKLLWDLKDWDTLEQRFRCASRLNSPRSIASRRAHVLRAIVLMNLHHNRDGAEELTMAWSDAQALNDFTPADTAELQWLTAIIFVPAGRLDQAEPYCRAVAERGGQRSARAAALDAFCLDHLGRTAEAQVVRKKFHLDLPADPPLAAK